MPAKKCTAHKLQNRTWIEKTLLVSSASYFNLGGLKLCFGGKAPVWCRSAHMRFIDPSINDALRIVLDACVLHQRTTFQSSQVSNLLSFVAEEPHYL